MAADTWTTVAAFTAAGLSVVNVAVTGIVNNRVQLSQWRRSKEIEIFAEFTQSVNRYVEACRDLASSMDRSIGVDGSVPPSDEETRKQLDSAIENAHSNMDAEFAVVIQKLTELEVIAGTAVITAGQDVALTLRTAIYSLRPGGSSFKMQQYHGISADVGKKLDRFTRLVRIEIGTQNRLQFWRKRAKRSAERIYEI